MWYTDDDRFMEQVYSDLSFLSYTGSAYMMLDAMSVQAVHSNRPMEENRKDGLSGTWELNAASAVTPRV